MNTILEKQFKSALQSCQNLHSSKISRDFIALFSRVAKESPDDTEQIIDILLRNFKVDRSNTTAPLYCLIKLTDVSDEMKKIVSHKFNDEQTEYYISDHSQNISYNAKILKAVLYGATLSDFQKQSEDNKEGSNMYFINSNVNLNSPHANQTLNIDDYTIQNLDSYNEETKQLLVELKDALDKKNQS
jgi:subtilase family serine protease